MSLDWYTERYDGSALQLQVSSRIHHEQSPWQTIEVFETTHFGRLLTLDGLVMLTSRDNFIYHEMLAHPALFSHTQPRDVAIIGGGDCGVLQQVLQHEEVQRAVQVELDERVTRVTEQYFPELCSANEDPRAELLFTDGIAWMETRQAESLDVIILDTTDPVGQAARLFSEDYYRCCQQALRPGGVLVVQSESPLFNQGLIRDIRQRMGAAGFEAVSTLHFPQYTYPSGWWSATMAGKDCQLDSFRERAALNKGFATRYYNAGIHSASQALPQFLLDAL